MFCFVYRQQRTENCYRKNIIFNPYYLYSIHLFSNCKLKMDGEILSDKFVLLLDSILLSNKVYCPMTIFFHFHAYDVPPLSTV